jgi:hypothetical protein
MKFAHTISWVFFPAILALSGCHDFASTGPSDDVAVIVRVTGAAYDVTSFNTSFPDTSSLRAISSAFSQDYSEYRRQELLKKMLLNVYVAGEDPDVVDSILTRCDCRTPGTFILPTLAERAHFIGRDVWIVQFAVGFGNPSFGHWSCVVYSIPDLQLLYHTSCR